MAAGPRLLTPFWGLSRGSVVQGVRFCASLKLFDSLSSFFCNSEGRVLGTLKIGPTKDEALSLGATLLERDALSTRIAITLNRNGVGPRCGDFPFTLGTNRLPQHCLEYLQHRKPEAGE